MVKDPGNSDRNIVMKFITELVPYPNNSRTHSDMQIAKLAGMIKEYGWTNPVLIDEKNGIIAGHGRTAAAMKLGMDRIPCIVLTGLSDAQRKGYVIADNRSAEDAGWDDEMLAVEMQRLHAEGFDLSQTGFDPSELEKLMQVLPSATAAQQDTDDPTFTLQIQCRDADEQKSLHAELTERKIAVKMGQ